MLARSAGVETGANSLLFGTNDSYDWSTRNTITISNTQSSLRQARFPLILANSPDAVIDKRVRLCQQSGMHYLNRRVRATLLQPGDPCAIRRSHTGWARMVVIRRRRRAGDGPGLTGRGTPPMKPACPYSVSYGIRMGR